MGHPFVIADSIGWNQKKSLCKEGINKKGRE